MFQHIPKINAGLGCLALLCFFMPWISFSCGAVTFLELSGYHLTAGKVPVDESVIRQYEQRAGRLSEDERVPEEVKGQRPKFIYLIVVICAANIIAFSMRMMDGVVDRWKSIAVMVFADIGFVFMIVAAILEFGMEIPPGSELLIQSSLELGYFGTLFSFTGVVALSLLSIRTLGRARVPVAPVELQITEQSFSGPEGIVGGESVSEDVADHFGLQLKKKADAPPAPPPPGAKTCPACRAVVGAYQAKCLKCGSALKPGS